MYRYGVRFYCMFSLCRSVLDRNTVDTATVLYSSRIERAIEIRDD
jgi:hypothetical protein